MKKIITIILAALSFSAQAVEFEVGIGHTQFGKTENGIWWQNPFDHTMDLQSNSWSVGATGYATSNVRWRAQWTQLGNISTNAQATQYDPQYNGVDGFSGPCIPLYTFRTEGSLRGLSLTVAPEFPIGGGFKGFVEGGVFYNLTKFYAEVAPCQNCAVEWRNEYREGWNWGTQLGAGVEYKGTQIVLTYYKADAPTSDQNAIINRTGQVWNLALRQRF